MKRRKLHIVWLWGLLLLMAACGEDEYYYPPVKFEFVTVVAGEDGRIQTLIPDKGEPLPVSEDRTGATIASEESRRLLSNYETISEGANATAKIYSLQSLVTPTPLPADDKAYENGIKKDPVEMVSIWMGRNYLNMILNLNVTTAKGHVFGIVEDTSELASEGIVTLLLYHDANNDKGFFDRRAYISVPLLKYADEERPGGRITIKFKYHTSGKDGSAPVLEEKYCNPGFKYIPVGHSWD